MKLATILLLLCVFVVEIRYFCLNFKRPEETAVFKWKQCHNMQKCRPFLQRCALISQDFAIFYREHIEFQNPFAPISISHLHWSGLSAHWCGNFKSVRNLIVTKTKRQSKNIDVTIEILRKSAYGCTNCHPDFIMRITIKALIKQCPDLFRTRKFS